MIEANMDKAALTADDPVGSTEQLTVDQFKQALPKQLHNRVTSEVMKGINVVLANPEAREQFRENLLSYTNVLQAGRFKINNYVDAVKYVSFKLLGNTNRASWGKTFPNRLQTLIIEGCDEKAISAHVAAYNANKLVNKIWEQTLIPSYVLNADLFQKALNTQAELMVTANSEKVRTDAANSILNHLKQPEVAKIKLDIAVTEDQSIKELREATLELAAMQRKMIESGVMSAKEVAHSKIIVDGKTGTVI